jgi:hypothetical protein
MAQQADSLAHTSFIQTFQCSVEYGRQQAAVWNPHPLPVPDRFSGSSASLHMVQQRPTRRLPPIASRLIIGHPDGSDK